MSAAHPLPTNSTSRSGRKRCVGGSGSAIVCDCGWRADCFEEAMRQQLGGCHPRELSEGENRHPRERSEGEKPSPSRAHRGREPPPSRAQRVEGLLLITPHPPERLALVPSAVSCAG